MSPKLYRLLLISFLSLPICTNPAFSDSESDQLAAQKAQLEAEVNSLNSEIAQTQASIQAQQVEFDRLTAEDARLRDEDATQHIQETELDIRLSQLNKELADAQAQLEGSQAAQALYEAQLQNIRQQKAALDQIADQVKVENEAFARAHRQTEMDLAVKQARLTELDQQSAALQQALDEESTALKTDFNLDNYLPKLTALQTAWNQLKGLPSSPNIPSSAVGSLRTPFGVCTAFLVAPDRIRTAAHCIHGLSEFGEKSGYTFFTAGGTGVTALYQTRYAERADLIELKLKSRIELETVQGAALNADLPVDMLAYNLMTAEYVTGSCHVLNGNDPSGVIRTDCESGLGMSGAPLFQNGKVVGYHIGRLGQDSIAMVFEPGRGQELSDAQASQIQYQYNCDADCGREVGFDRPCPTWKKPGRMCRESKIIPDPVCEVAKQQDCAVRAAAREAERFLNRLKEELHQGVASLGIQSSQLKISLDGLRTTLTDVGHAALGKNESVKNLQSKILDTTARIDTKRAEITRRALLVDETNKATAEVLKNIGVSKADVDNIKSALDSTTAINTSMLAENKLLKEAGERLRQQEEQISSQLSIKESSIASLNEGLTRIREEAGRAIDTLNAKIKELPAEFAVEKLPSMSMGSVSTEDIRRELRNFDSYISWKAAEIRTWLAERMKASGKSGCGVDDYENQKQCLEQKRAELQEKSNALRGMMDSFFTRIRGKFQEVLK